MNNPRKKTSEVKLAPEQWVEKYGNYLYHFALGRLRNTTDAQNAVQETFLAAIKARSSYSGKSTERTWLIGILKHKIIDHFRKTYREKPVSALNFEDQDTDQFFDKSDHLRNSPQQWHITPEKLLENKEFWSAFALCKEKLPDLACAAFTLKEIEQIDTKEICNTLKISASNFWVLMHRARLQLRECLEKNFFGRDKS